MLKIVLNEDKEAVNRTRKGLKESNGYCPCALFQDEDTKCMCKEFREQEVKGFCICKLYKKI